MSGNDRYVQCVARCDRRRRGRVKAALTTLCNCTSRLGPQVGLTTSAIDALPAGIAEHAYRVVEEALSNAARHAQAKVVRVDVRLSNGIVRIVIADDGGGFPFRGRYDLRTLDALVPRRRVPAEP